MTSPPERPEDADRRHGPAEGASTPVDDHGRGGRGTLRRSGRQKVVSGVCGGLGRTCDLDPVIFRVVIGVLTVTGGLGLVFYGLAWLLIPLDGEDENEARRMLSGRVDGSSLVAVLLALIGCGLFLSMIGDGGTLGFAVLLSLAAVGAAVWSQRRRGATPGGGPLDPTAAQTVAEAPPETKAPPVPDGPSWWRDPIVKDGNTGPVGSPYLWGPVEAAEPAGEHGWGSWTGGPVPPPSVVARRPLRIGGPVFLLALIAGGLGTGLSWGTEPLGTSLELGFAAALGVFGLGLVVSSFLGRTGFGTMFLTVVTALLLAGSAALPDDIDAHWRERSWAPASAGSVRDDYRLGTGTATLDLRAVAPPAGTTVVTTAHVGAGRLTVRVPTAVTVAVTAKAGVGDIALPGDAHDDVDVSPRLSRHTTLVPAEGRTAGTLVLRLDVGVGQVEVTRARS